MAAPATPAGAAERNIIRLSGEAIRPWAAVSLPELEIPAGRGAVETHIVWEEGSCVPCSCIFFPAPRSATGEDLLELHIPTSPYLLKAIFRRLRAAGVRDAEPGEFTRRAFHNGRLDLLQVESVLDLVHCQQSESARFAARAHGGELTRHAEQARDALLFALAECEASLDFEEGDAQDLTPTEASQFLDRAEQALTCGLATEQRRPTTQTRSTIFLTGRPNSGKTSLFAALTGVRALVGEVAGTTRDRREAAWAIRGTDIEIALVDGPIPDAPCGILWEVVHPGQGEPLHRDASSHIWTHADEPACRRLALQAEPRPLLWSAITGEGRERLEAAALAAVQEWARSSRGHTAAAQRHCAALERAAERVGGARRIAEAGGPLDLQAEELRGALRALAELVGEQTPEAVLDRLFSRFCVGK